MPPGGYRGYQIGMFTIGSSIGLTFERFDIGQISGSSGGSLVGQQGLAPDHLNGNPVIVQIEGVVRRFQPGDSGQGCEDVDADRRDSQLQGTVES